MDFNGYASALNKFLRVFLRVNASQHFCAQRNEKLLHLHRRCPILNSCTIVHKTNVM